MISATCPQGSHSDIVVQGDLVIKSFHPTTFQNLQTFVLWRNEVQALIRAIGLPGLQQYHSSDLSTLSITTAYAGVQGFGEDPDVIIASLRRAEIYHRDIIPRNLLVLDGRMTLIDFEWALFPGSSLHDHPPPGCLGDGLAKETDEATLKAIVT